MNIVALASILPLLVVLPSPAFSESPPAHPPKPCTIHSPTTGSYFDLSTLSVIPPELKDGKSSRRYDREQSWHAKGHDYPSNFTINICAPVIEELDDVVGVEEERRQNISAYYKLDGKTYSIGQESSSPIFRGRKLVLNYTEGSPCPSSLDESSHSKRKLLDGDKDDEHHDDENNNDDHDDHKDTDKDSGKKDSSSENRRTKSTIMSFLCDRELSSPAISFVGTLDSCSYVFEVRSAAACGGVAADAEGGVGPAGVFGIIAGIAVAAYLIGGCAYQRTVMHQRGWRQCPNAGLWFGIANFLRDMTLALFSSVCSCLNIDRFKTPRGYSNLSNGASASGRYGGRRGLVGAIGGRGSTNRSRRSDVDEENRLIDQLDEEWED